MKRGLMVLGLTEIRWKLRSSAYLDVSGSFGIELNERGGKLLQWCGEKLLQWCGENKTCITNTQFQKPRKKFETWISPDRKTRIQRDCIMSDKRFRNALLDTQVETREDCDSDHGLLVSNIRIRLKLKRESRASTPKN